MAEKYSKHIRSLQAATVAPDSTVSTMTTSLCFRVSITFVYFGLTVNSVSVGSNKYTSFILVALIELPAYVATYLSMNKFGRKFTLCITLMISGIPCTAFALLPPGTCESLLTFFTYPNDKSY